MNLRTRGIGVSMTDIESEFRNMVRNMNKMEILLSVIPDKM